MIVTLHSNTKEGADFLESIGAKVITVGKVRGCLKGMTPQQFWDTVRTCFDEGFAVKLYRPEIETGAMAEVVLSIDDNKWKFKTR